MYNSKFRFTLDLHTMQSQISVPVKFGDTAVSLYISIMDNGSPYVIQDGWRAVFSARKADGKPLLNNCTIEKNSIIRYDFTEHTATAEGIANCEITLYGSDGAVLGSPRFILVVDKRAIGSGDDIISQSERDAIDQILMVGDDIVEKEAERQANEEARESAETQREINEANRQKLYNFTSADAGKFVRIDESGAIIATDVEVGGGSKLYMHYIKIYASDYYGYGYAEVYFHVLSNSNNPISMVDLANYIPNDIWQSATGYTSYETACGQVDKFKFDGVNFSVSYWDENNSGANTNYYYFASDGEYSDFIVSDEIVEVA